MNKLRKTCKRAVSILLTAALMISCLAVGAFAEETNPAVLSVSLSETRSYITISFDRSITAATTNLINRIKLSKNGGSLYSLPTGSSVTISGANMYITMKSALTTANNYINISADALTGQTAEIKTPVFNAEGPELLKTDSVELADSARTVTIKFDEAISGYPNDDSLKNGYILLARNGTSYTEVIPTQDIRVNGDDGEIIVYLSESLTSTRSRFKIMAGKVQNKSTGNINLTDIITPAINVSNIAVTPEIDYTELSSDRYTVTVYFTSRIKNAYAVTGITASAALSILKSHIWVSRGSTGDYETLSGSDTLTVGSNYIRVKFDSSLSSSKNYIKIDSGSIADYSSNVLYEEILTGNITSGTSSGVTVPTYASSYLVSSSKIVIYFTTNIQKNPDITSTELRSKISVMRNGGSYTELTSSDSVTFSGSSMTISLRTPLSGTSNKLRIAGSAIASATGYVLSTTVTTPNFAVSSSGTSSGTPSGDYPEYESVEYTSSANRVRIYLDRDIRKVSSVDLLESIQVSRDGGAFTSLSSSDVVELYPSNALSIILKTPLSGTRNRFRILGGSIADYDSGYVQNSDITTDYVSASGGSSSSGVSSYSGNVSVSLSEDNYTVEFTFDEMIYNNMSSIENLKSKIQIAKNGGTFTSLGTDDYVRLDSESNKLVVILASPVKEFYTQMRILAGALLDHENKTISNDISTAPLGESDGSVRAYIDNEVSDIVSSSSSGAVYTATISGTNAIVELGNVSRAIDLLVKIPSDAVSGTLNVAGDIVEIMKRWGGTISLACGNATYILPLSAVDMSSVSANVSGASLAITVKNAASSATQSLTQQSTKNSFSIQSPACAFDAKLYDASGFGSVITHSAFAGKRFRVDNAGKDTAFTVVRIENSGNVVPVPSLSETKSGSLYITADTLTDGTYAAVSASHSFTDTPTWLAAPANELASRLILANSTGGKLNSSEAISRSETVEIMAKTLGIYADMSGASKFFDIISTDSYFDAVASTVKYNLIAGYPDSTFKPEKKLTREEAMTIVARAMRFMEGKDVTASADISLSEASNTLSKFKDAAKVDNWAKVDIAECVQASVVNGDNLGNLNPKANVTRGELIQLMYNILKSADKLS